ncbi:MAG: hypothetical protein Q8M37_12515 [Nevskia sp.]|nr:hypothetical protein [Nevskia sp.]
MVDASGNSCPDGSARIGFLFNHDHLHQIAHSAPIAFELGLVRTGQPVVLLVSDPRQLDYLQRLAIAYPGTRVEYRLLSLGDRLRHLGQRLDRLLPFTRLMTLWQHRGAFRDLDVLVVPEKTSLILRSRFGLKHLKFVHTRHGAGDREVGFDRASGQFDLVLMSGPKIRDRLREAGLLREDGHAITGYPKFDLHAGGARPKLFDNDRPTVLYNPHCSLSLSSWYTQGLQVLEAFRQSTRYNLIVAPHVMLFKKQFQVSLQHWRIDRPGDIPQRYRDCPHIHIDLGSERSVDMSYTRAADLYLGDASSQVYEFLHQPRPCLFLDSHRSAWQQDPNYRHWTAGPVIASTEDIEVAIDAAFASHGDYLGTQRELFRYSFDLGDRPSAQRGKDAILAFAERLMLRPSVDARLTA